MVCFIFRLGQPSELHLSYYKLIREIMVIQPVKTWSCSLLTVRKEMTTYAAVQVSVTNKVSVTDIVIASMYTVDILSLSILMHMMSHLARCLSLKTRFILSHSVRRIMIKFNSTQSDDQSILDPDIRLRDERSQQRLFGDISINCWPSNL
jgi:anti-anti-sigma regulatory factor